MTRAAILTALCLLLAATVRADDAVEPITTSPLINAALDRQFELAINEIPLPQAMQMITRQTGVPLTADPAVWDMLPWGQQSRVSATIKNQTLREALTIITRKFGLQFQVKDDTVLLEPTSALKRLARRATVEELAVLDVLAATPLDPKGAAGPMTAAQLIAAVDQRLQAVHTPYSVENQAGAALKLDQAVSVGRNSTLMDALDDMRRATPATWYPSGNTIVILDKQDQVRRQLEKTINLRYSGVDVAQVLADLQQRSGAHFEIDPTAMQQLPSESRNIHLVLENVAIQDALDAVCAFTGLSYKVHENSVFVWYRSDRTPAHDPIIGIIQLDNGFQILVPESQVPPDMREYLKYRTQRELEKIRHMMNDEGFKGSAPPVAAPTTQPG